MSAETPEAPAAETLAERLRARGREAEPYTAKDSIEGASIQRGDLVEAARWLQGAAGFTRFIDLTCVDWPEAPLRFELHLLVYSMAETRWARLVTRTDAAVSTLTGLFPAAHNYEREIFDLFGVTFEGHPALTRILMPEGWQGHPLRRDAPLVVEPVDFTVTRDVYGT